MDESEDSEASDNDTMFVLGTGFVCLRGHIVLGVAGYPKLDEVAVPDSGQRLELQRPQAVDFLLKFVVGKESLSRKQGHRFIRGLGLDQLIQIEARLQELEEVWPLKEKEVCDKANEESDEEGEEPGEANELDEGNGKESNEEIEKLSQEKEASKEYKLFGHMYKRGDDPVGIVDVLGAGVPADLLEGLQAFVLTGFPGLAECEQSILEAFETQARRKEEAIARKNRSDALDEAMRGAGFRQPFFQDLPSDLSTALKAYVKTGNPSLAECERLIREECESRKQHEERTKALELRKNTIYQALRQAGFHSPLVPHPQSLSAYIQVSRSSLQILGWGTCFRT